MNFNSNDEIRQVIGDNLRQLREQRNSSLEEIADEIDVTPGFLGLVERGKRGTQWINLLTLANLYEVEIGDLFVDNKETIIEKLSSSDIFLGKISLYTKYLDEDEQNLIVSLVKNMAKKSKLNTENNVFDDHE